MNVSISVGGSTFEDREYISALSDLLRELANHRLFVVVGGGKLARTYIELCRGLGADETFLDDIGIDASRLNAKVLIAALGDVAYPRPLRDYDEALQWSKTYPIIVMGGTHPGHTTDAVAALLAERVRASKLIISTNVDGIYEADPKTHPDAKLIREMTQTELVELTSKMSQAAGSNVVVDPLAARIIFRSKIPSYVLNGTHLGRLRAAIAGASFKGSVIK